MFLETSKGVLTIRASTPDSGDLEGPAPFAKPFFAGNHREITLKNNGRNPAGTGRCDHFRGTTYCCTVNSVEASTFTPGPIVDEIATRLM